MGSRRAAEWREADFENWFAAHPVLPGGERLLIVSGHEPIRRMVDITAVDAGGGIVVIEVKNAKAHRMAIGQALEYLAHLDAISLEDIEDDFADYCGEDLRVAFQAAFGIPVPPLSSRRRVYLVAPNHDTYSAVCASYLSKCLAPKGVHFSLLTASKTQSGFSLSEPAYPVSRRPTAMEGRFGTSPGGRLFYVLDGGSPPIVWAVGDWNTKTCSLSTRMSPSRTVLRAHRRLLLPIDSPPQVNFSLTGSHWLHRSRPGRRAVVIGSVRPGPPAAAGAPIVAFAQFRGGAFQTFRRRPESTLETDWIQTEQPIPTWRELATEARRERM